MPFEEAPVRCCTKGKFRFAGHAIGTQTSVTRNETPATIIAAVRHLGTAYYLPQKRQCWPDRFSERFHIFALGETFDVDAFLSQSSLRPDFVWQRMGNGPTNGLEILLGDADTTTLRHQEEIAVNYLRENRDELRALASFPGVEALNLGLVYRVGPNSLGFCLGPSRALMISALESGVRPNYYCTIIGR